MIPLKVPCPQCGNDLFFDNGFRVCTGCDYKKCLGQETAERKAARRAYLTDGVRTEIVKAYLAGKSTATILTEYDISPGVMYRILHRTDTPLREATTKPRRFGRVPPKTTRVATTKRIYGGEIMSQGLENTGASRRNRMQTGKDDGRV